MEVADHAFPPPRTALSHSKMLVRSLRFKVDAFKESCAFICIIVKESELDGQPCKKKIGLDEQPSKKFTKLEIRRIATD